MASITPHVSAPGCLVNSYVKSLINGISNDLDLARTQLQTVKNTLYLKSPLQNNPGTRLSSTEKHSALHTGYDNLDNLIYFLESVLENVKAAMNLINKG
ncbi:uncharacterized protein BDW43DRAFT_315462 [Aspergillus alliaceus]|uniref:uncharacterized protein n=1 Tax=Petromyces alliaceus TaxID=209559 RepID=UPI0012A5A746|nr:uncharacterized protein BDW43DRAFT_315462 [Aspergillus alliaceus]KAB8228964.1 hypothetical protein BDW43DRAFT_315462 [Aspergillus alliaceus]